MARFSTQLSGSHILVTGGTKGIGKAIVEAFLSEGANVSYCARSVRGDDFAQFKNAADGARVVGTSVDISNQSSIEAWVESSAQKFGRIDVVVANATPFFTDATRECWQQAFQADILGLITLIEAATPHLIQRPRTGSIIIISSLAGFESRHPSLTGPYATFKRAQATLAKEYARKLGPHGVRINAIVPGAIETPSVTRSDGTVEPTTFQLLKRDNPSFYQSLLDSVPMGRTGSADEVANAVVFLGSPLASYVSGAHLAIDGAMSVIL